MNHGHLILSLDFELYWGVHDKKNISSYLDTISNVHSVLPQTIDIFDTYNICGTFATVGFLFYSDINELLAALPNEKPAYIDKRLSPYEKLSQLPEDRLLFASDLIQKINRSKRHELGSHTFSHYYCLEEGQDKSAFKADMEAAINCAKKENIQLKSIVFPRNQVNANYLEVLEEMDFNSYRGNENSWFYSPQKGSDESLFKRGLRLLDSYFNISGHNTYSVGKHNIGLYNFPSSRFLRPYSSSLRWFEPLRLQRILKSMEYAAKNNEVFHLWWHPHNFGSNVEMNFLFLKQILEHYTLLNAKYGFKSVSMSGLVDKLNNS